jgi:eukaryotic-like serine/threonine-protein kinase
VSGHSDLWILPMNDRRRPVPLTRTSFDETFAEFSPDTRWIAYQSNQTGRDEVYVRPFSLSGDGTLSPGSAYQVSQNGGMRPLWRRDGRELVYIGANRTVFAVDVVMSAGIRTSPPRPLFQMPAGGDEFTRLEMDANGQRFLVRAPVQNERSPITVVMNWPATLRQ